MAKDSECSEFTFPEKIGCKARKEEVFLFPSVLKMTYTAHNSGSVADLKKLRENNVFHKEA